MILLRNRTNERKNKQQKVEDALSAKTREVEAYLA